MTEDMQPMVKKLIKEVEEYHTDREEKLTIVKEQELRDVKEFHSLPAEENTVTPTQESQIQDRKGGLIPPPSTPYPEDQIEATKPTEERQSFDPDKDFQIGYMIGIQNDSKIFWRVFGRDQNLTGLLGVHQLANANIKIETESKLTIGDALIRQLVDATRSLAQQVNILTQRINQPTNKL